MDVIDPAASWGAGHLAALPLYPRAVLAVLVVLLIGTYLAALIRGRA
jgi:hypothetical protein